MTKRTSPFFTNALSFAGNSTRRPLTSGAISMKLVRTLASSVRGLRSVSRITSTRTRMVAMITPLPIIRPQRLRSKFSAIGSICASSPEEDQPQRTCRQNDDAGIEESQRTHFCLQAIAKQDKANHECHDHARRQADHPGRKERPQDVDRGRT